MQTYWDLTVNKNFLKMWPWQFLNKSNWVNNMNVIYKSAILELNSVLSWESKMFFHLDTKKWIRSYWIYNAFKGHVKMWT